MTIDLRGIITKAALHELFKQQLAFPDWYGVSWDAFWDCIVAVVPMPAELRLENWQEFAAACPRDMDILHRVIADYAAYRPGYCIVLG